MQTLPDGATGRVAFDSNGDRVGAEYKVINVQGGGGGGESSKARVVEVGQYGYSNVSSNDGKQEGYLLLAQLPHEKYFQTFIA